MVLRAAARRGAEAEIGAVVNVDLRLGDCLDILPTLAAGSVDAVITDPPYSSGGQFRGDRAGTTRNKYLNTEDKDNYSDFAGDNRDQRGYLYWSALWLSQARRIIRAGGVLCVFTDWRQLPTTTDAVQCGGWVWRGIVPWNKTEAARPQKGRFRQQCEYVVWATAGPMVEATVTCLPGFFTYPTMNSNNGKEHIAEKPTTLMRDILQITDVGFTILDPFMGGGSTGVACIEMGRSFIGCEIDPHYFAIAQRRIAEAQAQLPLPLFGATS